MTQNQRQERKFRSKFLAILATGESLTYSTGLVKYSDHHSPRKSLLKNDSIATYL